MWRLICLQDEAPLALRCVDVLLLLQGKGIAANKAGDTSPVDDRERNEEEDEAIQEAPNGRVSE